MGLAADVIADVNAVLTTEWNIRTGVVVPESDDVTLAGGGVRLDATVLYADLAGSTAIAIQQDPRVAAKIFKCFLAAATRIIRLWDGDVRSFDGDRVMGIFIGKTKNTYAATSALQISWAMSQVIKPKLEARYPALRAVNLSHATGIDSSSVLAIRAGIRNNNDLVWVGRAPNVAAKLSAIREPFYSSYITEGVFSRLADMAKYGGVPQQLMWERRTWSGVPGVPTVYRSSWTWRPAA